jgi:hypothetical protein
MLNNAANQFFGKNFFIYFFGEFFDIADNDRVSIGGSIVKIPFV